MKEWRYRSPQLESDFPAGWLSDPPTPHPKLALSYPFIQLGAAIEKKRVGGFSQQSAASHSFTGLCGESTKQCLVKM